MGVCIWPQQGLQTATLSAEISTKRYGSKCNRAMHLLCLHAGHYVPAVTAAIYDYNKVSL